MGFFLNSPCLFYFVLSGTSFSCASVVIDTRGKLAAQLFLFAFILCSFIYVSFAMTPP